MSENNTEKSLKYQLLDEFFSIGGNHRMEESKKVGDKLRNYLENNSEDLQVRDTLIILETFELESKFNDFNLCRQLAVPILDRLSNTNEWDFYDIRILTCVADYANTIEQADALATAAIKRLGDYSHEERSTRIKLSISLNMTMGLLRAKFSDSDSAIPSNELGELFSKYINLATALCDEAGNIVRKAKILVRKGIFYRDATLVNEGFNLLKQNDEYDAYRQLKDEVREHKFKVEFNKFIKNEYRILVGRNIRTLRINRGLEIEDLAEILDVTVGHMGLMERGERGVSSYFIAKLAETFNVSTDVFYSETDTMLFKPNNEALLDKLNIIAKGLTEDKLELVIDIAKGIDKLA